MWSVRQCTRNTSCARTHLPLRACALTPADNVRERAAANLGGLSKMSPRVDQLASDLAQSARTGEPLVRCLWGVLRAGRGS